MLYAEISEAWNSPLSTQIKNIESGNYGHNNNLLHNNNFPQDANQTEHPIDLNTGSIIPAWGSHSEPINEYLRKNDAHIRERRHSTHDYQSDDETYHYPKKTKQKPKIIERIIERPVNNSPIIYNVPREEHKDENMCDVIEQHINKCRYCHNKYNKEDDKNNNFVITMDYKNMLLTITCFMIIIFIIYCIMKK